MKDKILYEIDKQPSKIKEYFEHLFQEKSDGFLKTCKIVTIKMNERFISTGEKVDKIWICIAGSVKVMEEFKTGETYIFTEFLAPEMYGEMETLAGIPLYRSSLVASTDATFIVGSAQAYITWMKQDASTLYERAQYLASRLMDEGRNNRAYLLLDGMDRLKVYFTDSYQCNQHKDRCVLKNTRQQISDETGYSVKTVNRVIKKLSDQKLLTVKGRSIIMSKEQYLEMLETRDEKVNYEN